MLPSHCTASDSVRCCLCDHVQARYQSNCGMPLSRDNLGIIHVRRYPAHCTATFSRRFNPSITHRQLAHSQQSCCDCCCVCCAASLSSRKGSARSRGGRDHGTKTARTPAETQPPPLHASA